MGRLDMSAFFLGSIASGYAAKRGDASAKKDEITVSTMICRKNAAESISRVRIRRERKQIRAVEVCAIPGER